MHPIVQLQQYAKKKFNKNSTHARLIKIAKKCKIKPFTDDKGRYTCVYIIRHVRSGCFYIGVHTDDEPNSVLRTYTTSSNVIHAIMGVDGKNSFVAETVLYFGSRSDANFVENLLIQNNSPSHNVYILNKMHHQVSKKKLVEDATVKDWSFQDYKGKRIKINPKCKLLDESYKYYQLSSTCEIPTILYKKPKQPFVSGPARIIKANS